MRDPAFEQRRVGRVRRTGLRFRVVGALALLVSTTLALGRAPASPSVRPAGPTWQRVEETLHHHAPQTVPACGGRTVVEGASVVDCAGLIDSFDGLSISVVVWLSEHATGPLPTLVYLHAFGSGRGEFSSSISGYAAPFTAQSLAARGFAVVTPAARGMNGSCGWVPNTGPHDVDGRPQAEHPHGPGGDGSCRRGWSHLNDRQFETRDVQHLLGSLVDAGVADEARLFAAGYSYGGSQTWMLATSLPWSTPAGRPGIQLAGAVPIAAGTSAINTFAPNGRASDDAAARPSLERPHGVPKLSAVAALLVGGRAQPGLPRFNDVDPAETHSYAPAWAGFWARGEPFDTPEGEQLATMFRVRKSAYPPDGYLAASGRRGVRRVPILAVQGWNDTLFTPVETLLMYRALRAADPRYPISLVFADVGHPSGRGTGTPPVRAAWNDRVVGFLDLLASGRADRAEAGGVLSFSTECAPLAGGAVPEPVRREAADWDAIHPGTSSFGSSVRFLTSSAGVDPGEQLVTEPANPLSESGSAGCITQLPGTYDTDDVLAWPVPPGGLELLGLPTVTGRYRLAGPDATLVVKLWDRAPDGTRTLVSRGVHRLALRGGSPPAGELRFQLFGNHYLLVDGHTIELELAQTDVPYLQPDRFESTVEWSDIRLDLPIVGSAPTADGRHGQAAM